MVAAVEMPVAGVVVRAAVAVLVDVVVVLVDVVASAGAAIATRAAAETAVTEARRSQGCRLVMLWGSLHVRNAANMSCACS
ncbi:hypothetical protein GCM10027072_35350 [Streptomyces bullii]